MMRRSVTLLVVLIAMLVLSHAVLAAEFSADVVMSGGMMGKGASNATPIYVKGKNIRAEMAMGRMKQIQIVNGDKKLVWTLDPVKKTYWEQPLRPDMSPGLPGQAEAELRKLGKTTHVGTETINGYPCEKTVTQGKGLKITAWISKKLGHPIKTETIMSAEGTTMTVRQEYKNIKERTLPASLFEVPKGYKKVARPTLPMGMGRQGRGGGPMRMPMGPRGRRGG